MVDAGIIAYEPLEALDLVGWQRVIAVNQTRVFLGMRAVVPAMRGQKNGSIVNFSSIWGNAAIRGAHAYHATKGAVALGIPDVRWPTMLQISALAC